MFKSRDLFLFCFVLFLKVCYLISLSSGLSFRGTLSSSSSILAKNLRLHSEMMN